MNRRRSTAGSRMAGPVFALLLAFWVATGAVSTFAQSADPSNPFDGSAIQAPSSGNAAAAAPAAAPAAGANSLAGQYGFVNVNTRLNVRDRPWGTIIGKLYDGDKVKILGREGDWLKIEWEGRTAYVHSAYVNIGGPAGGDAPDDPDVADPNGPTGTPPAGTLDPANFGYDSKRFKAVFDVVERFCKSNKAYVFGAGHTFQENYAEKTDCSGFVGQFIQKLAGLSGVPPVFPKKSWFPTSQVYKTQYTNKVTSAFPPPNPRDLIKPGDVFVMNPGSSGVGHVGLFMGYTRSGQPIIAHSTPSRVNADTRIAGKVGASGVRIEVLPRRYASRWSGVYRVKNMDRMLDRLGGS